MKASNKCYDLIKLWEASNKCYLEAYKCPAGVWTIGWGATYNPTTLVRVKEGDKLTQNQADEWLDLLIEENSRYVNHYITSDMTQNQFDALVSLCYNIGAGNFRDSWVTKNHNAKNYEDAFDSFMNHVYDSTGTILQGLINRREDERNLYAESAQITESTKRYLSIKSNAPSSEYRYMMQVVYSRKGAVFSEPKKGKAIDGLYMRDILADYDYLINSKYHSTEIVNGQKRYWHEWIPSNELRKKYNLPAVCYAIYKIVL